MPRANPNDRVFYVYALLDGRKPRPFYYGHWKFEYEPFYLGKGKGRRYEHHLTPTDYWQGNGHKGRKIRKIQREGYEIPIRIVRRALVEKEAFDLEVRLIHKIGRCDKRDGPLTNQTRGGEGATGRVITRKTRRRLSRSVSKALRSWSEERWAEHVAKRNATKQNKSEDEKEETRRKQSEAAKRRVARTSRQKMKAISKKRSKAWYSKSEEERQAIIDKRRRAVLNRSEEAKRRSSLKKSESLREMHAKRTPKEKATISANLSKALKKYCAENKEEVNRRAAERSARRKLAA